MGLGHVFGLGTGERRSCRGCGRLVAVDPDEAEPACPACGSTDLERVLLA